MDKISKHFDPIEATLEMLSREQLEAYRQMKEKIMTPVEQLLGDLIGLLSDRQSWFRCLGRLARRYRTPEADGKPSSRPGRCARHFFMQGQLDETYLQKWAEKLGIVDSLQQALHERWT